MTNRLTLAAGQKIFQRLPYPLDSLKKPIPLRAEDAATALGYHGQPVDLSLPLAKEPLVMAKAFGLSSQSFYARTDGANAPYNRSIPGALAEVWMRESVAVRLVQANQMLANRGLQLHLWDAYRPIETQQSLWQHFIDVGRRELNTDEYEELRQYAGQFVSEPSGFDEEDPLTWPTHNTGGAVDVTLKSTVSGHCLDMGSGYDESTDRSFTDHFERGQDAANKVALNNRRILYNVMLKVGFANYPYEWWHFDYGTQMWLQNGGGGSGCTKAWYGPARLPA
jgi:D-alanyl-D-alanine dipeptidase